MNTPKVSRSIGLSLFSRSLFLLFSVHDRKVAIKTHEKFVDYLIIVAMIPPRIAHRTGERKGRGGAKNSLVLKLRHSGETPQIIIFPLISVKCILMI